MVSRGTRISWSLLCAFLCLGVACAHNGPEHQIEALSERLIREGASADVLLERAIEYRVLGKLKEAARDLQRAVRLAPGDSLVLLELAQIELQRGRRIFHRISYFEGEVGVYGGFFMVSSVFRAQGLFDGLF